MAVRLLWRRELAGEGAEAVRVSGSRILVSLSCRRGTDEVVALDFDGNERWRLRERRLEAVLPGVRSIVRSIEGSPELLDEEGECIATCSDASVRLAGNVERIHDELVLRCHREIVVTNLELRVLRRMSVPDRAASHGVFLGDRFVWFEGSALFAQAIGGEREPFAFGFRDVVEQAHARFREGRIPVKPPFGWNLGVDRVRAELLVGSFAMPHVAAALRMDGTVRWWTYLSHACCGDRPVPTPRGYVVGLGCGGRLLWLDEEGKRLVEDGCSSPRASVLPDGRVLARGGSVICYSNPGEELWRWNLDGIGVADADPSSSRFVCAHRAGPIDEPKPVCVDLIETGVQP